MSKAIVLGMNAKGEARAYDPNRVFSRQPLALNRRIRRLNHLRPMRPKGTLTPKGA